MILNNLPLSLFIAHRACNAVVMEIGRYLQNAGDCQVRSSGHLMASSSYGIKPNQRVDIHIASPLTAQATHTVEVKGGFTIAKLLLYLRN